MKRSQAFVICSYCEHGKMECEPVSINASSFAANLSLSAFLFAVNVSRKRLQMRAATHKCRFL
ncbi:MAG TPA: hypothetical protein DIW64_10775 [Cellvibrio sp.]|nr:hypothetical protein [Cellvibrio sp.]